MCIRDSNIADFDLVVLLDNAGRSSAELAARSHVLDTMQRVEAQTGVAYVALDSLLTANRLPGKEGLGSEAPELFVSREFERLRTCTLSL
eukprot:2301580-Prymnesium_polylepis.1